LQVELGSGRLLKQLLQQTKANDTVVAEAMLDIDAEYEALCGAEVLAAA